MLFFVDNESARLAAIKGVSPSLSMLRLTHVLNLISAAFPNSTWFERVASKSNLADLPSRFQVPETLALIGGKSMGTIEPSQEMSQFLVDGKPLDPYWLLDKRTEEEHDMR